MSNIRQNTMNPDFATSPLVGQPEQWGADVLEKHSHARHQLIFSSRGVIHIKTHVGEWVLPPSRALWIDAGTEHYVETKKPASLFVLYISPAFFSMDKPEHCCVVEVSNLVRELIIACAKMGWTYDENSYSHRLAEVLVGSLSGLQLASLELIKPKDPRAIHLIKLLEHDPGSRRSLHDLAREAGASGRTVERLFAQETNLPFGAWRQRHRMLFALERLAYGQSVINVALESGYESASSFIAAFKAMFGTTPSKYFS
ncbi:TPA: helix-turn-helix transcriptional regulator [Klebsiella pneumoniae]|nr:helix-turn-helix transcriptional regulator [Klebsiella pneumoniae]